MVPARPKPDRKLIWKLARWVLYTLLLALIATYCYVRYDFVTAASDLDSQILRAKKHGLALSAEEMRQQPPVKPEDNAAPIYRKLATALNKVEERKTPPFEPEILRAAEALSSADISKIENYLERYSEPIELAVQALKLPHCDFDRDWRIRQTLNLSPLGEMRAISRIIIASSLAEAQKGNWDRFFLQLSAVAKMESHMIEESHLFAGWYGMYVDNQILLGIESASTLAAENVAILQKLVSLLQSLPKSTGIKPFLKAEAISGYSMCRNLRAEYDKDIETLNKSNGHSGFIGRESLFRLFPLPFESETCERAYASRLLKEWNDALDLIGNDIKFDSKARLALSKTTQRLMNSRRLCDLLPSYLFPSFDHADRPFVGSKAQRECVQATLELLLYKKKHGRFPDSLPEAGINRTDLISDAPLKYLRTPTGFRVYCFELSGKPSDGLYAWESSSAARGRDLIISSYPSWERYSPTTRVVHHRNTASGGTNVTANPSQPTRQVVRIN